MFRRFIDAMLRREKVEAEMTDEIRAHQELRTADLVRKGTPLEKAQRQARIDFGPIQSYKKECRRAYGFAILDDLRCDLGYSWRSLFKSPGFFLATILTLALGIGANTSIFSVLNAVVLRDISYPAPDRVARLGQATKENGSLGNTGYATFLDWLSRNRSFTAMAAYKAGSQLLTGTGL